jgi:hypothetical protein
VTALERPRESVPEGNEVREELLEFRRRVVSPREKVDKGRD